MSILKYKNELGEWIPLADINDDIPAVVYSDTAPSVAKIWCDTYVPPFSARLLVDTDEGATVVASKGAKTINCVWQEVQIPNPEAHGLPDGYTELSYIESSGTQYINTNIHPNSKTKLRLDLKFTGNFDSSSSANKQIFYATDGTYCFSANFGNLADQYNNIFSWFSLPYDNISSRIKSFFITDEIRTSRNTFIADRTTTTNSYGNVNFESLLGDNEVNDNLCIFGSSQTGGIQCYHMVLYYAELNDESHHLKLIPCKNSSNQIGLYDLVSNTFFANAGTGDFIAGDIVPKTLTEYRYIGNLTSKGTWTVTATKGQKTASDYIEVYEEMDYHLLLEYPSTIVTHYFKTNDDLNYLTSTTIETGAYIKVENEALVMGTNTTDKYARAQVLFSKPVTTLEIKTQIHKRVSSEPINNFLCPWLGINFDAEYSIRFYPYLYSSSSWVQYIEGHTGSQSEYDGCYFIERSSPLEIKYKTNKLSTDTWHIVKYEITNGELIAYLDDVEVFRKSSVNGITSIDLCLTDGWWQTNWDGMVEYIKADDGDN